MGNAARQRAWTQENPKWAWAVRAAHRVRVRAEERGVPFEVDSAYIYSIMPDKCPVFGTVFIFYGGGQSPQTPTLDRLNPAKGYVKGNVAVISHKANAIKSAFVADDVWKVALWLTSKDL